MSKRNYSKTIKFSTEEFEKIKYRSDTLNMKPANYIRTIAIDGEILKLEVPEYRSVILEMNRIGNNINQIARRLNETGSLYYDDIKNIKEVHEELCLMLNQYLSTLHLKKV